MMSESLADLARAICGTRGLTFGGLVGTGAFKQTFKATQPDGKSVALKIYADRTSTDRAAREIDALQKCDHPNIAKLELVDVARTNSGAAHLYCVEEFLSGGTLTTYVEEFGMLSADTTRRMIRPLIGAVGHLEARELVHRDLKPDNVMLRGDRRTPVIVDFGLVRNLGESSLTHTWAPRGPGTPFYAPPEQLLNEKSMIDWRADQFSLGVTFALLALQMHPYAEPGDDDLRLVVDRVADRRLPTSRFVTAATEAGLTALIKMVAAWPVQRYRTPAELMAAWGRVS